MATDWQFLDRKPPTNGRLAAAASALALGRGLRGLLVVVTVATASCSNGAKPAAVPAEAAPATSEQPASAEAVFEGTPGLTASRLASECMRRRIAVVQNTPELVVCKHIARGAVEIVNQPESEVWTFALSSAGERSTRVQGHRSYDGVAGAGYAVLSFNESDGQSDGPIRLFVEQVRTLDGLRGRLAP